MPLSARQIKFINSLKLKKNRQAGHLFIAEGEKVVHELIGSSFKIQSLYTTDLSVAEGYHGQAETISDKELSRISALSTPNKVLAVVEIPSNTFDPELALSELVLALDGINDPGNLGTIMRIADWFGIRHIVCSADSVDAYNPKTVQSSMGSIARTNVHYANLPSFFEQYSGHRKPQVFGALLEGQSIYETGLTPPGFLVMGSESHGISEAVVPYITHRITIPRYGQAESLNVATATAVICAEFRRNA